MIYQGSYLRVLDNTGALTALCIKVFGKTPKAPARHGDKILVVVKTIIPNKKAKRHHQYLAVVVWNPTQLRREDGSYIKFDYPACVLVRRDKLPIGTRVRGPVCKELRELQYIKLVSIASLAL